MTQLLTVGTVAFDTIETPFAKRERVVGGACTFIAMAAAQLTPGVAIVSVIGDDFPEAHLALLRGQNIDLEGLEMRPGENSFFWHGRYHLDMNSRDTLDTQLGVLAAFEPKVPEASQAAPFLMLGNLTPAVQASVLSQMKERPKLTALDTMNFWMDIALDDLKSVLKSVDLLLVNDEEARQLSGERSLLKAARTILTMGPKYLAIKKGEHGALLFGPDARQMFYCPALPLEDVVDPTGAGDSFAGGLMGYVASVTPAGQEPTWDALKRGVVYGSAIASICVEGFGTEALEGLSKGRIEARVAQFASLTQG